MSVPHKLSGLILAPLVVPKVNLNGTSIETLFADATDVYNVLLNLGAAMSRARPHGRDFQTMPDGTYEVARQAWLDRMVVVEKMQKEFATYREAIADQFTRGVPENPK